MNLHRHNIIGKQEIQFTFNGKTDALLLNRQVDAWYKDELFPAVQTVLDKYGSGDKTIRLDELIIDVDIESGNHWQHEMTEKIISQLNEQLSVKIDAAQTGATVEMGKGTKFESVLLFYIENGYLPWFSSVKTKAEFLSEYKKWLTSAENKISNKALLINALVNSTVLERFLTITPHSIIFRFFALLIDNKKTEIKSIENDVHQLLSKSPAAYSMHLRSLFFRAVLLEVLKSKSFTTIAVFKAPIKKMLKQLVLQKKISATFLSVQKVQSKIVADVIKELPAFFNKRNVKLPVWKSEFESIGKVENTDVEDTVQKDKNLQVIFISNAGLVILSPFLPVLFERLKITDGNIIADKALALHILFYLTTGKQNPAEFELVLPKVICGIGLSEIIVINKKLTADQKKESDELLSAVINHWSVLKNTSVEGLRSSFLQRDGKLSFADGSWLLQVEQKSYDMLLEQLPWNISMIRHSWMDNLLRTEWM